MSNPINRSVTDPTYGGPIQESSAPKHPVEDPNFWHKRMIHTLATGGMLHEIIYQESYDVWAKVQGLTGGILLRHILSGERVLDAGCGYGATLDCFEEARLPVQYTGIDISSDLIELAIARYIDQPRKHEFITLSGFPVPTFMVGDVRKLPFPNNSFDWAICRDMEDMITHHVGLSAWKEMEAELRRVCTNLFICSYEGDIANTYKLVGSRPIKWYLK